MDVEKTLKAKAKVAAQAEAMERDLSAIRRALRQPLEVEIAGGGLTVPQTLVMRAIVHQQGISLKELSKQVSLAHSTVSGIVDRLEKRSMIERRPDQADGRVCRIYPSVEVVNFVREQIPMLSRRPLQAALERATIGERVAIGEAVKRLRELVEKP